MDLGRSVVFSAFYADFCLCPNSVIITTLSVKSADFITAMHQRIENCRYGIHNLVIHESDSKPYDVSRY